MDPLSGAGLAVILVATGYAFARKAPLSLTYALAAIVIFALEVISVQLVLGFNFLFFSPVLQELGLDYAPGRAPDPWTWASFQFVHGGIEHLFLNLLGFLLISPILEERIGSARWALLFFLGGIAGAGLFILMHFEAPLLMVGASAGLLALLAAFGRLYPTERIRLFLPLPGIPTLPVLYVVIGFLVLELALSLLGPAGVAWEGHVGGMLFGFAAAPFILRLPVGKTEAPKRVDTQSLRVLAATPELSSILDEAERADLPEVREAWIEKFMARVACPRCGGRLHRRIGRLSSDCGWSMKLR